MKLSPTTDGVSDPDQEVKKAKTEAKIAKIKAKADATSAGYKRKIASWIDDAIIIVVILPFVLSFFPWIQDNIRDGFVIIDNLPEWYRNLLLLCVSLGLGLRGGQAVTKFKENSKKIEAELIAEAGLTSKEEKPIAKKQQPSTKGKKQ